MKYLHIFCIIICIECVSYSQMYSLYGIDLLTTPNVSESLFKTFTLEEDDYLSKKYIGVTYDNIILHLSYMKTSGNSIDDDEKYKLTIISRIYDNSSFEEWVSKVELFRLYFKVEPEISVLEDLTLRIANWKFVQTNTIFNVLYNESGRRTIEVLSYDYSSSYH